MMQLNMNTVVALTKLFLPDPLATRGKILNTASTAASQPGPYMAVYCATKSFVLSFSGLSLWLWMNGHRLKSMAYPLVVIALMQIVVGSTVYLRTDSQVSTLSAQLQVNPATLKAEETARMETYGLAAQKGPYYSLAQFLGPLFLVELRIRTHAQPKVGLDGNVFHGIHLGMIQIQQTETYAKWFAGLRDRVARARIDIRIRRLSLGTPGMPSPLARVSRN